jgi:hypothetical protein
MRAKTPLFLILVALLMGSMFAVANPVAAAPAEVYRYTECYDYYGHDVVGTRCIEVSGVSQFTETVNGIHKYTVSGTVKVTDYVNGELNWATTEDFKLAEVAKAGELLAFHELYSGEWTDGDETVSVSFHLVIANGEVRLQRSESQ